MDGFKKKKRPQARRTANVVDDDQANDATSSSAMDATPPSHDNPSEAVDRADKAGGVRKARQTGLLSFGDEEDAATVAHDAAEASAERLAAAAAKKKRGKKKSFTVPMLPADDDDAGGGGGGGGNSSNANHHSDSILMQHATHSSVGEYSAERMAKLRQETLGMRALPSHTAGTGENEEMGGGGTAVLSTTLIPDASAIFLAKKKREMARQVGGRTGEPTSSMSVGQLGSSADFVTMDTNGAGHGKGKAHSRLVREDDNDHSEEDEEGNAEGRMTFDNAVTSESKKQRRRVIRAALDSDSEASDTAPQHQQQQRQLKKKKQHHNGHGDDDNDDDDDDDDERVMRRWETAQIRKGGKTIVDDELRRRNRATAAAAAQRPDDSEALLSIALLSLSKTQNVKIPSRILSTPLSLLSATVDASLPAVQRHTSARVALVREEAQQAHTELERLQASLDSLEQQTRQMTEELSDVTGPRFEFLQRKREYIDRLIQQLDEKSGRLTEIEVDQHKALRTVGLASVGRRRRRVDEQMRACATGTSAGEGAGGEREERARRHGVGENAMELGAWTDGDDDGDDADADGDSAMRSGLGGMSEVQSARRTLIEAPDEARELFATIPDEFSPRAILEQFHEWRTRFPQSYTDAYVSLALPYLFAPFMRAHMVGWNPFGTSAGESESDFESASFLGDLATFSSVVGGEGDAELVPQLVDRTVIGAKLTGLVTHVWDAFSRQQCSRLGSLLTRLEEYYPLKESGLTGDAREYVYRAVAERLQTLALSELRVPPKVVAAADEHQRQVQQERIGAALKGLTLVTEWAGVMRERGRLGDWERLRDVAVETLIGQQLATLVGSSWENNTLSLEARVSLAERIVCTVAKEFAGQLFTLSGALVCLQEHIEKECTAVDERVQLLERSTHLRQQIGEK